MASSLVTGCLHADGWSTCIAAALYVTHSTLHLYDGLRVSIFSDVPAVDLLTFLSDLAFPIAAGLSLVAHSPDFHLQTGATNRFLASGVIKGRGHLAIPLLLPERKKI